MKKYITIIAVIIFLQFFTQNTYALKRYSSFLQIEHGKSSIVMSSGEKQRLQVYTSLFVVPVYKKLHFSSSNILVAAVDDSGIVHSGIYGKAYVTVVDSKGRTDSILIIVESSRKTGVLPVIFLVCMLSIAIFLIKTRKCCKK